jgi:hypothetical protein
MHRYCIGNFHKYLPFKAGSRRHPSDKHNFKVKEMMVEAQQENSYLVNAI